MAAVGSVLAALLACGAIDRAAVVRRHTVQFVHKADTDGPIDPLKTAFDVLTVGNGELGFSADLTGLQSLNNSYTTPRYPLYTMSNWGWHTPSPATLGATQDPFLQNGELNYQYENVTINSSDTRPGKGNRTVPYQFNCDQYNDPVLCHDFWYNFPARVNLGQLGFILAEHGTPPPPGGPYKGCSGIGEWCSDATWCETEAKITVSPASLPTVCNTTVHGLTRHTGNETFCARLDGSVAIVSDTFRVIHEGFFDGSCDRIQWDSTLNGAFWCKGGGCGDHVDGGPAGPFRSIKLSEITAVSQSLDMVTGILISNWTHTDHNSGVTSKVQVATAVDSKTDSVAVRYTVPSAMPLAVQLAFCTVDKDGAACSWNPTDQVSPHTTTVLRNYSSTTIVPGRLDLSRANLMDTYSVSCEFSGAIGLTAVQTGIHAFAIRRTVWGGGDQNEQTAESEGNITLEITCRYELNCCVGPDPPKPVDTLSNKSVPSSSAVFANSIQSWRDYWNSGAFIDMSGSTGDPQAFELERRTIQSMFLLRSQEAGTVMPQESGLLYNSWQGKHHSEMRYWHQAWLPLWGRPELLAKSDQWFLNRLENATSNTARQGYKGTRWGKMLGEANLHGVGKGDGTKPLMYWESPNNINPALVWHQPHVIYMSEMQYKAAPNASAKEKVLHRLSEVVMSTAMFLADFPERRLGTGTNGEWLDLGPPLVSASEQEGPYDVWNPTYTFRSIVYAMIVACSYELTQFNFSLDIANQWRERLGLRRNWEWDYVRMNLAPLPVSKPNATGMATYNRHQNCLPTVFASPGSTQHCSGAKSHPALNGAFGCLPGDRYGVDRQIMNNTLAETLKVWSWDHCWGWDQPMVAMTATRLGQPRVAIDMLLMNASTNSYISTGYNHPGRQGIISAYLPGNGGTLLAVGMMAGGWEDGPRRRAPGFPEEWHVTAEGFTKYL